MTQVRLREPYGFLPKNSNVDLSPTEAARLIRELKADTQTTIGTTYVPAEVTRWNAPVSLRTKSGVDELYADRRVVLPGVLGQDIYDLIMSIARGRLANPDRATPYPITATTYFYNPAATGTGTGLTPTNAFTTAAAALAVATAGNGILILKGSTFALAAFAQFGSNGTSTAPIVFGVYDQINGARISGVGLATISVPGGNGVVAFLNNNAWIGFDSLKFTGANGTGNNGFIVMGGSTNNIQVTNCDLSDSVAHGVFINATGANNVVDSCVISRCAGWGIYNLIAATNNTNQFNYNRMDANVENGIICYDSASGFSFNGQASCNTITNSPKVNNAGVFILTSGGGSFKGVGNTIDGSHTGIKVQTAGGAQADFGGSILDGNTVTRCGWFGIERVGNKSGVSGRWIDRWNKIDQCGSYDGITSATPEHYGRAIEYFGSSAAIASSGGYCVNNKLTRSFNFIPNASEGVGVGLDDSSRDIYVGANVIENCQGNAVQLNSNLGGCDVVGNFLKNNAIAPAANGAAYSGSGQAEIVLIASPGAQIANNTIVTQAKYGIVESSDFPSAGANAVNNLILGATVAGIARSLMTESHNIFEGIPGVVVDAGTLLPIAAGVGTVAVPAGTTGANASNYYVPRIGSIADGTGTPVDPSFLSLRGETLQLNTPIGAQRAA